MDSHQDSCTKKCVITSVLCVCYMQSHSDRSCGRLSKPSADREASWFLSSRSVSSAGKWEKAPDVRLEISLLVRILQWRRQYIMIAALVSGNSTEVQSYFLACNKLQPSFPRMQQATAILSSRAYSSVVVEGTTGTSVNLNFNASRAEQSASWPMHVQKGSHCALALGTRIDNERRRMAESFSILDLLPLASSVRAVLLFYLPMLLCRARAGMKKWVGLINDVINIGWPAREIPNHGTVPVCIKRAGRRFSAAA